MPVYRELRQTGRRPTCKRYRETEVSMRRGGKSSECALKSCISCRFLRAHLRCFLQFLSKRPSSSALKYSTACSPPYVATILVDTHCSACRRRRIRSCSSLSSSFHLSCSENRVYEIGRGSSSICSTSARTHARMTTQYCQHSAPMHAETGVND